MKTQRYITVGGETYRYVDAKKKLGLLVTDKIMRAARTALNRLDCLIVKRRKKGLSTQALEEKRCEQCHAALALRNAGFPWVRVQSRTTQVLQPDESGELVVMRYVHGAATTRFIHDVDTKVPVHGQPMELSPPTGCRTMDHHATYEKANHAKLVAKRGYKRTKRKPIEIGVAFLRGGAHAVKRNLSYQPKGK